MMRVGVWVDAEIVGGRDIMPHLLIIFVVRVVIGFCLFLLLRTLVVRLRALILLGRRSGLDATRATSLNLRPRQQQRLPPPPARFVCACE